MKRDLGWFQIGSGLALSLLFLIVLPACTRPFIEVSVGTKCVPEAVRGDDPTGPQPPRCNYNGGTCMENQPHGCRC